MSSNDELREALIDELTVEYQQLNEGTGAPYDLGNDGDRMIFTRDAIREMQSTLGKLLRKKFPNLSEKQRQRIKNRVAEGIEPKLLVVLKNLGRAMR